MKKFDAAFVSNMARVFTVDELAHLISDTRCTVCIKMHQKNGHCSGECTAEDCANGILKYYEKEFQGTMETEMDPDMEPEDGLKPCPCCGHPAILAEDGELSRSYKVFCTNPGCDAQYGWCADKDQAVKGWNKRV